MAKAVAVPAHFLVPLLILAMLLVTTIFLAAPGAASAQPNPISPSAGASTAPTQRGTPTAGPSVSSVPPQACNGNVSGRQASYGQYGGGVWIKPLEQHDDFVDGQILWSTTWEMTATRPILPFSATIVTARCAGKSPIPGNAASLQCQPQQASAIITHTISLSVPLSLHTTFTVTDTVGCFEVDEAALRSVGGVLHWGSSFFNRWATSAPPNTSTPTVIAPTATPAMTPLPDGTFYRVNAGGGTYVDGSGDTWAADQPYAPGGWGYVGGTAYHNAAPIGATNDDALYQTERWWNGTGIYKFTLPNGLYNIDFKFAEIYPYAHRGIRVFTIAIEGPPVVNRVDIMAAAGFSNAYDITVPGYPVVNGLLEIHLSPRVGAPQINAIRISLP
jgi:hypothetical protein